MKDLTENSDILYTSYYDKAIQWPTNRNHVHCVRTNLKEYTFYRGEYTILDHWSNNKFLNLFISKKDLFGQLKEECWHNYTLLHREIYPAVFNYNEMGMVVNVEWYIRGKCITNEVLKFYSDNNLIIDNVIPDIQPPEIDYNNLTDELKLDWKLRFC